MSDTEPRRRASDFMPPRTTMDWVRENSVLVGAVAVILVGIAGSAVFYTRLSDMIPVVAQMRKDLDELQQGLRQARTDIAEATARTNELRLHLDKTLEQADTVRGKLQETDTTAAVMIARMQEQIRGLQDHATPLPFYPPGKGPPR